MSELIFEVLQEADGGFCAECLTEAIFTQGDTWEELRVNVKEAVEVHYYKRKTKPQNIRLHLVRDESLACTR
ncbi:MAG: type II toxin-antitoxin system HicB family antitoxin [Verrucomicrobiia bacterium]|jgi:predicted RNase H-like HicB family nuclease